MKHPSHKKSPITIGGMATMPSRANTAPQAISSALDNVEHLYLYLDRFDEVPHYAKHERITIFCSQDVGEIGANGKLLALSAAEGADYYACFDDDILYPKNFVERLHRELEKFDNHIAVGVHGSVFNENITSYYRDRIIFNAPHPLIWGKEVDILATCGTLHSIAAMKFDVRKWNDVNMVDLGFALEAKKAGLKLRVVARKKGWVKRLSSKQPDSISMNLKLNDTVQTKKINELVGLNTCSVNR
ncbi:MAG: hypothetical protein HRU15_03280 [Planctomycetes bacterium]|nr:hypothetical protein [Planctomycetota bacterium]